MNEWIEQTLSYWKSGGFLLIPIALVCLGIWGLFLRSRELFARTIRDGAAVENALEKGAFGVTASGLASGFKSIPGGIAALFYAAIADVQNGAVPVEAILSRESECLSLLRKDLLVLVAFTAVAPLLGLLGTVMGMIQTFDAVATIGGDTGTRVAAGISQALITTQFGLVVAVPGIFGIARLQRMLRNIQMVMAICRSHALQVLEHQTKDAEL